MIFNSNFPSFPAIIVSARVISKSVTLVSSLSLLPGADTTTILLSLSDSTMSTTFLEHRAAMRKRP